MVQKLHIFGFSNIAFIIPSHIIIVPYFTLWMLDTFNTIRMTNILDLDQARHFIGPDLGPNCLKMYSADHKNVWMNLGSNCSQKLSADKKNGQRVK